jgi:FAD binding domain-containing protein
MAFRISRPEGWLVADTAVERQLGGAIEPLREQVRGRLITAEDEGYEEARAVHNGMFDRRPLAVLKAEQVGDVIAAVRCAGELGLDLSVRGGGHSGPGFGTNDGGLVIDMGQMRTVRVDPRAKTAQADAGATWGDFNFATHAFGLATTGGIISTTGIAGLTLGGGIGYLCRGHGLTIDNLISADVVTADGRRVTCSEESNADLLWGLRGGGGNFGVVTNFEFRLHPVGPLVLGGLIGWPLDRASEILAFHREQTRDLPDELGISTAFVTAPPLPFVPEELQFTHCLVVILCYSGDPDDGRDVIKPWLDLAPPIQMVEAMPYTIMNSIQDDLAPKGRHSYWKSGYLTELTDEVIDAAADVAAMVPSPFSLVRPASQPIPLQRHLDVGGRVHHRSQRRLAARVLRRDGAREVGGCLRQLPLGGGAGAGAGGLRRRQVRAPAGAQGRVRPDEPVPLQPEHPTLGLSLSGPSRVTRRARRPGSWACARGGRV